jgi:hypothetical protein
MTTATEQAQKIVYQLEERLEALLSRTVTLHRERAAISYAALTANDKAAKLKLDAINTETLQHSNEVSSVELALVEAKSRLTTAQQAEVQAADRDAALKLRTKAARFKELGDILDDCFSDFKSAAIEMKTVIDDIHALGCPAPAHQSFKVNADLAFKTAVMGTPFWTQDFPHLAPNQRKSFASLVSAWHDTIIANVEARLGDTNQQEAAA